MAKVNTRIQSKHDVEKNWANATFAPLPGEIIIYDKDKGVDGGTHEKPRIKVGDGTTAVGSLPFVVDKEATDAAIAEVDATVQGAIKDVSVSGKVLTFTKVDGSTVTATTQDTNTDTKVTNTKANTTKAYVTGTTNSATNTGTQVFDTGVYLGTEAGSLHATKFVGKAMKDDLGNTISTTYETQADATEKLSTAKAYTDTKTANMNKDAYLTWGGRNLAGQVSPLDASLVDDFGANRFAFYPNSCITLEYSTNGGSTWTVLDSAIRKKYLVGGNGSNSKAFNIGNSSAVNTDKSNYMCRVTFYTTSCLYTVLNKFAIQVSTNGSTGCYCTVDARRKGKQDANEDTWITFADKVPITGWSGWNIINTESLTTHGYNENQFSQIRFTFGVEQHASSSAYPGLAVWQIQAYGPAGYWSAPSNMSRHGHIYHYDEDKNVQFPATVTATMFNGSLHGTAQFASSADTATTAERDKNGNIITATYATKAALEKETNCTRTLTGNIDSYGSLILADIAAAEHNVVLTLSNQESSDNGYLWRHNAGSSLVSAIHPVGGFIRPLGSFYDFYDNQPAFEFLCEDDGSMNSVDWTDFSGIMCYTSSVAITNLFCTMTADTTASNQYYLATLFYSASLHKVFALPAGTPYSTTGSEYCSIYFDNSTGKLYTDNTFSSSGMNSLNITGKHVYEGLPSDLVYFTSCIYGKGSAADSSTSTLTIYTCNQQKFWGGLNDGQGTYNFDFEKCGTYLIPYNGRSSQGTLYFDSVPVSIDYTVTYLSDSSHVKLLPHIRDCSGQNFLEEFNKVVSSGTADPNGSTPGVLYFKYL